MKGYAEPFLEGKTTHELQFRSAVIDELVQIRRQMGRICGLLETCVEIQKRQYTEAHPAPPPELVSRASWVDWGNRWRQFAQSLPLERRFQFVLVRAARVRDDHWDSVLKEWVPSLPWVDGALLDRAEDIKSPLDLPAPEQFARMVIAAHHQFPLSNCGKIGWPKIVQACRTWLDQYQSGQPSADRPAAGSGEKEIKKGDPGPLFYHRPRARGT